MKVLLLTDRMVAGGAETHLFQLACGLQRLGVDVTLLSGGGAMADELEQLGIPQIRLPFHNRSPIRLLLLRRQIHRIVRNGGYTILHAHARLPAALLRGLGKRHGTVVVSAHASFRTPPLKRLLSFWGERTVAVSEDLRQYLIDRYRLPAERITVIPNGIDHERFQPPKKDTRMEADGICTPAHILFASRMDADCARGAELLCRIAPSLYADYPKLRITLAGGGSESERIHALAGEINHRLGAKVIDAVGHVRELSTPMQSATVFVGVSRAAMEAMACECPVLLCGNEGYFGILSPDRFSYAAYTNFCARGEAQPTKEALERDLRTLLDNSALRATYAAQNRQLLLACHTAEQMCRATLALYRRFSHVPSRATVTVGGYFGCGNVGDDAILSGLLETIRILAPEVSLQALTAHPIRDRKRFGIRCYHRILPSSILFALGKSDLFLLGGGSLLQDLTGRRSLRYYLTLLSLAQRFRPTALYACGIGPLLQASSERVCRRVLCRCRMISLRDEDSLHLLQRIGVHAELLHLGADAALLLPPPPTSRSLALLQKLRIPNTAKLITVILRATDENGVLFHTLSGAIRTLCTRHAWTPVFLCMDLNEDRRITLLAAKHLGGYSAFPREVADVTALLRASEVTLTMRLHGMILACTVEALALGISQEEAEPKLISFGKRNALPVLTAQDLTVATVVESVEQLCTHAASTRALMRESLAEQQKNAQKDLENILQMLYNKK